MEIRMKDFKVTDIRTGMVVTLSISNGRNIVSTDRTVTRKVLEMNPGIFVDEEDFSVLFFINDYYNDFKNRSLFAPKILEVKSSDGLILWSREALDLQKVKEIKDLKSQQEDLIRSMKDGDVVELENKNLYMKLGLGFIDGVGTFRFHLDEMIKQMNEGNVISIRKFRQDSSGHLFNMLTFQNTEVVTSFQMY